MADRETINRSLRQKVHDELDRALVLLRTISDASLRTTAEKSYDDIFCWVKDRTKRVKTDSLKQLFIATNILIEKMNSYLGIKNGTIEETSLEKHEKEDTHNHNVTSDHQINLDQQVKEKSFSSNTTVIQEKVCSSQGSTKDKRLDEEILEMASAYDSSHVGPSTNLESVEEFRERIALKYPRKKIDSELFKRPDAPQKRPSSPLFLRRHEINPPKQTAATYAEHKRQMHAKRIWESRTEPAIVPSVVPSPLDPRIEFYKRLHDKTDPRNVETHLQPLTKHGPHNNETQNLQGNQESTNQNIVQCKEKSTVETCTSNEMGESLELPETLTTSVDNSITNVFDQAPGKVMSKTVGNGTTNHTTNIAEFNAIVDVPSAASKGRPSRELHLLLSDATNFLEKTTRKEQSNKGDQQHKETLNILQEYGITRDVSVVLDKTDLDGNVSSKPKLRRRNSICVGTLSSSSEYNFRNLDKPSKESNKTMTKNISIHSKVVEEAKPASKAGKKKSEIAVNNEVVKPLSKGGKKQSESVANDKRPLNYGATTSKQQCKSGAKTGNAKTNDKRKIQATHDPVAKKQRCETLECSDKSVLNEPEKQTTTLQPPVSISFDGLEPSKFIKNNNPTIHCNSKYTTSCCLCNYQVEHQTDMVKHYVYEHPASEPFVSRVTPECAKTIKQNPFNVVGKRVVSRHGPKTISFSCLFCEKRNTLRRKDWVHHLVNHTGEYRFRCRACPAMARTLDEQVQHDDICGDPEMIVCNDITFDENHVYGYMCEKCNFVQIRRFNMDRHLQREHPAEETACFKFSLVNYELDSESQSFHGLVKCEPKAEENWLDDSNVIVKEEKIPDEPEELEALESVPKQMDYPNYIEKQELILPDDCDDSNDSQCTLPMTANDEDSWNILDLEEYQSCDQQKVLSVVKKEIVDTEQCNVLNNRSENEQTLVENVCDNGGISNQWQLFTNSNIAHKIILKRTNRDVVKADLEEDCIRRADTIESNEGASIIPDVPLIRIRKLPGDNLSR